MNAHRLMTVAAVGLAIVCSPMVANAKSNHNTGQKTSIHSAVKKVAGQKWAGCPPGLAKKSSACVPPRQAKKAAGPVAVGQILDLGKVHLVTRPGRYGLSRAPAGNDYAVVDGKLVRVDSRSGQILSILRSIDTILD